MRVLALVPDAFGGRGGIAQFCRDMSLAISGYPACSTIVVLPRSVVDKSASTPTGVVFRARSAGSKARYLLAVLRETFGSRFDVVICGHINLLPLAAGVAATHRARLALVLYGIEAWEAHRSPLVRSCLRQVELFIPISEFTWSRFDAWAKRGEAVRAVIPCCVDLTRFVPGRRRQDLIDAYGLEDACVIMTLARLAGRERYKGIDEVLECLPMLIHERPNLRYLIVGEGSDRHRLEAKAAKLGIREHVVFAGYIAEHEKPDHYRLADVFAMPGRGEGFGIVFLEALACGIPVVASRADGSRETVRNGLLGAAVDPQQPDEIMAAIRDGLARGVGTVPGGLSYFASSAFERRWHDALDRLVERSDSRLAPPHRATATA